MSNQPAPAAEARPSAPAEGLEPANARKRYEVRSRDLPLCCPMPHQTLWNSHPRVYLPIVAQGGRARCPYCSAEFVLVD